MPHDDRRWSLVVGDPGDPWTARLIERTPRPRLIVDPAPAAFEAWPEAACNAGRVVVHAAALDVRLTLALRSLRRETPPDVPFLLVQHPLNRYAQVEPLVGLFTDVLTEATALEVLDGRLAPGPVPSGPAAEVAIVSNLSELGYWLHAACRAAGFEPRLARRWADVGSEPIAVWDLPVPDGGWEDRLRREARRRAVIVLGGFLDRPLVERLDALGAAACLDLPCSADDLAHVLNRLAIGLPRRRTHYLDSPAPTPPAPASRRRRAAHLDPQARFRWDG
jgi:hypothetical protein